MWSLNRLCNQFLTHFTNHSPRCVNRLWSAPFWEDIWCYLLCICYALLHSETNLPLCPTVGTWLILASLICYQVSCSKGQFPQIFIPFMANCNQTFTYSTFFVFLGKIQFGHSDLVLWCHYVPGAGDTSWVVLLRPVGRLESPWGFVQSASTVLLPCEVMTSVISWRVTRNNQGKYHSSSLKECVQFLFKILLKARTL